MPEINNIVIAGLGISGFEAALLALEKCQQVFVLDTFDSTAIQNRAACLTEKGAEVITNINLKETRLPIQPDAVVISPGIDPRQEFGQFLNSLNAPILSELEFAALYIKTPMIGITGTNGKTTTVELITHCLKMLGKKAIAAGNIGYALCKVAREENDLDFIVVEVSSFQLEAINKLKFKAAAVLNISSDHVDRYDSFEDYGNTKLKILSHTDSPSVSRSILNESWEVNAENLKTFSVGGEISDIYLSEGFIITGDQRLKFPTENLNGLHNAENLMAAMSVLRDCGFPIKAVYEASFSYKTAPHRMQFVVEHKGIQIYNDSKSTNPHALKTALESLGTPYARNIVLIAGGRDKKMDFKIVNTALCSYTREVYLYGECTPILYEVWKDKVQCIRCKNFNEAVQLALSSVTKGELLLLSPGCSSLDSFRSYEERGNEFVKTVQEWTTNER